MILLGRWKFIMAKRQKKRGKNLYSIVKLVRWSFIFVRGIWLIQKCAIDCAGAVLEKKYTQDHEWIDLAEDGKIGKATPRQETHYSASAHSENKVLLSSLYARTHSRSNTRYNIENNKKRPLESSKTKDHNMLIRFSHPSSIRHNRHNKLRVQIARWRRLRRTPHPGPPSRQGRHYRGRGVGQVRLGHHDAHLRDDCGSKWSVGGEASID